MTNSNTPSDAGGLVELAGQLSDKQRAAMLACRDEWLTAKEAGVRTQTLTSLCWFWASGADPISPCVCLLSRDYQDSPLRYIYRLTPLGLALKAHLASEQVQQIGETK